MLKQKFHIQQNHTWCPLLKLRKAPGTPLHQMTARGHLVPSDAAAINKFVQLSSPKAGAQ